jgi:hypothetical protein
MSARFKRAGLRRALIFCLALACWASAGASAGEKPAARNLSFQSRSLAPSANFVRGLGSASASPMTFTYPGNDASKAAGQIVKPAAAVSRNPGRAFLEIGTLMTYSMVRYWLNYAKFIEDWQYHFSWKDQRKRFFTLQAWKFDSNAFSLNWTHSFAGVLYYNLARTNHLSWSQSFLFSLGGSLWWEYCAEWREVISINDNLMTGFGGYAAGEPWFQVVDYFIGHKGILNGLLSFLNPALKLNHWLDGRRGRTPAPIPEPGWHDFRLYIGQKRMPTTSGMGLENNLLFGFQTRIVQVPEYGKVEQSGRTIRDTLASDLSLEFAFRHGRIEEFDFDTRVTGLGYFKQDIGPDSRGYAYIVGMGSAFTLYKKKSVSIYDSGAITPRPGYDLHLDEPRNFRDKMAAVHIIGPVFDYTKFSPASRLRLVLAAYLDFGLINSYALNKYSIDHDINGVKTTLMYYGYYYGIGTSITSGLTYNYRNLELEGLFMFQAYRSVQGHDRFQSAVTDDFILKDSRFSCRIGTAFRIPGTPVEILARYEGIDRLGIIKATRHHDLENRYAVYASYRF